MTDSKFEGFRKSYRWLFSLPGPRLMLVYALALSAIDALIASLRGYTLEEFLIVIMVGGAPFVVSLVLDSKVLTVKRLLGFFSIYLVFLLPFILLKKPLILASIPAMLISSLVFVAIARRTALIGLLATYFSLLYAFRPGILPLTLMFFGAYLLVAVPILYNINRRVLKAAGVGGLKYLRGFLRYVLAGEKKEVEECLKAATVRKTVPIHVFEFKSNGETLGKLIVSGVHPGPLRTLGSSTLPEAILTRCQQSIFLKAPAGHGENLADSGEVSGIAERVCSETNGGDPAVSAALGIAEGKLVNSIAVKLSNGVSLSLIDPQVSMEDLPASLREEFEQRNIILADLHNMIDDSFIQLPEDPLENPELYLDVKQTILESLGREISAGSLKVGLARSNYSDGVSVGKGGISCIVFEIGGRRLGIISVDGNNMDPTFKTTALRELSSYVDHLLLATTDTHVMTGLFQGVDYYPVGSMNREQLLENMRQCLQSALSTIKECRAYYRAVPVNTLFMDGSKLKGLSRATRFNTRDGLILALLALSTLPILLLL